MPAHPADDPDHERGTPAQDRPAPGAHPRRALIVLNAGIGNTVMSVPLLGALAAARPRWRFLLLATDAPSVARSALPEAVRMVPPGTPPLWRRFLPHDQEAIRSFLAAHRIDLIINLRKEAAADDRGYHAFRRQATVSGLECWDLHELSENEIAGVPFAAQVRELLARHGCAVHDADEGYLDQMRTGASRPTVGLFLGASSPVKRWRPVQWQDTAELLLTNASGSAIEIAGGHTDAERRLLAQTVRRLGDADVRVRELSAFSDVMDWIATLDVLVAGDTAALHVAHAQGVPNVGIFFSTLASVWGPRGDGAIRLQSPIGERCKAMRVNGTCRRMDLGCPAPCRAGVRPADVAAAVVRQLRATRGTEAP